MDEQGVELNDKILENMASAMIDHEHKSQINSIDFSDDGSWLVTCDDFALHVYDVSSAKKLKTMHNKVSKIEMVKFTHNKNAVICATKTDHKLLYWSIHENEIVKSFQGHEDSQVEIGSQTIGIICLEINPQNDLFLSSAKDQKFKLWDLQKNDNLPAAFVDLSSKNSLVVGNFDPDGVVFALAYVDNHVGGNTVNKIRLYDINKIQDGSFNSWNIECPEIRMIKFSESGQYMLLSTIENCLIVLDAFDGTVVHKFTSYNNDNSLTLEASFTPDSKYVASGSENGNVVIWSVASGQEVVKLKSHLKPSHHVKFSSSQVVLVSGCKNLIFWLPKDWKDTAEN